MVTGNKEQLKHRLIKATNSQLKLTLRSRTAKRERKGGGPPAGEGGAQGKPGVGWWEWKGWSQSSGGGNW